MLAGAFGHTYGNHNIWQMWEKGRTPVNHARTPWHEAIDQVGSAHMGHMRELFLSRPFLDLVPDQSVLAGSAGTGAAHQRAAQGQDGQYLIAYAPYGRPVSVWLSTIEGTEAKAWWFDPRTGKAEQAGTFAANGSGTFDPPGVAGRGRDWGLVVDAASADSAPPGTSAK